LAIAAKKLKATPKLTPQTKCLYTLEGKKVIVMQLVCMQPLTIILEEKNNSN
jgi:hypothetical protein